MVIRFDYLVKEKEGARVEHQEISTSRLK